MNKMINVVNEENVKIGRVTIACSWGRPIAVDMALIQERDQCVAFLGAVGHESASSRPMLDGDTNPAGELKRQDGRYEYLRGQFFQGAVTFALLLVMMLGALLSGSFEQSMPLFLCFFLFHVVSLAGIVYHMGRLRKQNVETIKSCLRRLKSVMARLR